MGRIDDVLNVAGHRLGTMEIESALVAHPRVAEAAVVGKPHEIKGESVFAFVVCRGAATHRRHQRAGEGAARLGRRAGRRHRQARRHPLRRQPAQDALGQDHAAPAAVGRARRGDHAGRLDAGEPGDPRSAARHGHAPRRQGRRPGKRPARRRPGRKGCEERRAQASQGTKRGRAKPAKVRRAAASRKVRAKTARKVTRRAAGASARGGGRAGAEGSGARQRRRSSHAGRVPPGAAAGARRRRAGARGPCAAVPPRGTPPVYRAAAPRPRCAGARRASWCGRPGISGRAPARSPLS